MKLILKQLLDHSTDNVLGNLGAIALVLPFYHFRCNRRAQPGSKVIKVHQKGKVLTYCFEIGLHSILMRIIEKKAWLCRSFDWQHCATFRHKERLF